MNCPFCGKEMEKGRIPTNAYEVMWLPESVSKPQFFIDNDKLKRLNGIVIKKFTFGMKNRKIDADICRNCKKGIFSYDENATLFV